MNSNRNLSPDELEDLLIPRKGLARQYHQDIRMAIQNATDLVLHGGAHNIEQWIKTHFRTRILSDMEIHTLVADYMLNEIDDHMEEDAIERLQRSLERRFSFPQFRVHFFKEQKGLQQGYVEYWPDEEKPVRLNAEGINLRDCIQNLNRLAEAHILEIHHAT